MFRYLQINDTSYRYMRIGILVLMFLFFFVSIIIWIYTKNYYDSIENKKFQGVVTKYIQRLKETRQLDSLLSSGVGFIYGSKQVSEDEWNAFTRGLDLYKNYPELSGIGYIPLSDSNNTAFYFEPADDYTYPNIEYKFNPNKIDKEAMNHAIEIGSSVFTKKIKFDGGKGLKNIYGMIMYMPVYNYGALIKTAQQRKKNINGFVYILFSFNKFVKNIGLDDSLLEIRIYDDENTSQKTLLYDSFTPYSKKADFYADGKIKVKNLKLYVELSSTKKFDDDTYSPFILVITLLGLIANFLLFIVVYVLINSLKKLREQTEKTREQTSYMLHQSRLAQMGEMISMIAHQWRQPLSSISTIAGTMALDVMMDEYDKDVFSKNLDSIGNISQHLSTTIDDFRDFFKDKKQGSKICVDEIIDDTLQIIGPSFEAKNIEVVYTPDKSIFIYTYANEVKQVLLNILKNAEDILLDKKIQYGKIWISYYLKDNYLTIDIEDNAGGIDDDVIGKVFEPYFSTKNKSEGTGLGLYMSKTIIQKHCKGKLYVSNSNKGAKFSVTLPETI